MTIIRVITDSAALFNDPNFPRYFHVGIVPFSVDINGRRYRDGVDLDSEGYWHYIRDAWPPPPMHPPTVEDYIAAYEELEPYKTDVIVITSSSELSESYNNAQEASQKLLGRVNTRVVNSRNVAIGMGLLVEAAARAGASDQSLDDILRMLHGMIARLYSMFYITSLDPLEAMGHISRSQSILGTMLEIKPLLTIEDGMIVPIEKVFNRTNAIEKMVEFTAEFINIANLFILHGNPNQNDDVRALRDRLSVDFPGRYFPVLTYGPTLATYLGTGGLGLAIYED